MTFAIKRTGDANYPRHMNILLMGPPKSGKTTFIATMPNVVVAACEAGLMSVAHLDLPYVEIDGTDKLQTLLMILQDEKMREQQAKSLGIPSIDSVAIDTVDALQERMMREILKENRRTQMQRDDWGTLKDRMDQVLKAFCDLPINVCLTVHTEVTQDENQKQIYAPSLQGAIKNKIAGMVDFSLMTFRQKEVDNQGVPSIKYYLKNEGDEKNPHLGNRSQGRVPEICDPDFKTLHALTFAGINAPVIKEEPEPETVQTPVESQKTEEVAQSESQPEEQKATGQPEVDDSEQPINAAGITMLTKEYAAQGFDAPKDLETWNLGKARMVARFFVAWKADNSVGKASAEDLIGFLEAAEAYNGLVQTPVETPAPKKSQKSKAEEPQQEVQSESTETGSTPVSSDASEADGPSHHEAVELVKDQLGGKVVGQTVSPDSVCEVCNNQIDDVDIAQLAVNRFDKVLCVNDYKAETRK